MFDQSRADKAIKFIELLSHTKGAFYGQPFKLLPWQKNLVANVFGTVRDDKPDTRQYSMAYTEIPKKQGKSELGAAVALYLLCADGEQRAEVYGCAADRQQASIIYDVAVDMVRQQPVLKKHIKILQSTKRMVYLPTSSIYQVLSSDVPSKHGLNVSGCVFDELHTQPTRELWDVMTQGSGDARKQPLWWVMTTAGTDRNSICWEIHSKAKDLLAGKKKDPYFYPVIYGLDDEDDWTDERNWYKANPSLGITIDIDKVRQAFARAQETPSDENMFRQLRLNQWVKQSVRWMPMDRWDQCRMQYSPEDLKGRECYAGLDLSATTDITAFVLVFPPLDGDPEEPYLILPYCWVPEESRKLRVRRDHVPYDDWVGRDQMRETPGDVVSYEHVRKDIKDLAEIYNIKEIAFDRWNASMLVQELQSDGMTMVQFGQGFRDMSPPTKELMRMVLDRKIAHDGNPVLRWCIDNAMVKTDPAGNIKIDKEKSTERVDLAIALVMALDRASRSTENNSESVYDMRGLLTI